jgi:hypothetical protein
MIEKSKKKRYNKIERKFVTKTFQIHSKIRAWWLYTTKKNSLLFLHLHVYHLNFLIIYSLVKHPFLHINFPCTFLSSFFKNNLQTEFLIFFVRILVPRKIHIRNVFSPLLKSPQGDCFMKKTRRLKIFCPINGFFLQMIVFIWTSGTFVYMCMFLCIRVFFFALF